MVSTRRASVADTTALANARHAALSGCPHDPSVPRAPLPGKVLVSDSRRDACRRVMRTNAFPCFIHGSPRGARRLPLERPRQRVSAARIPLPVIVGGVGLPTGTTLTRSRSAGRQSAGSAVSSWGGRDTTPQPPNSTKPSRVTGLRGADADPARGDPAAARGPRPARPGGHRHRQDGRVRAADAPAARPPRAAARAARGARPRAHARARDAGVRGDPPLRPRARRPRAAGLRRPADRAAARALERGVDVVVATPGRALDHLNRGTLRSTRSRPSCSTRPTRCSTWASPRTSRRSSTATPAGAPDRAVLGDDAAADRAIARAPARPGPHHDRREKRRPGRGAARPPDAYVVRARTSRPRSAGSSTSRPDAAIVFCRTRDEVDELTETLNGAATAPRRCTAG
jgi:hypothetical protein